MTTNEEARVAKARSEAMNAYPAERFEQALSPGAVRVARRHAFERGYLAALAAAPDHQAEAPEDEPLVAHLKRAATKHNDPLLRIAALRLEARHVQAEAAIERAHAARAVRDYLALLDDETDVIDDGYLPDGSIATLTVADLRALAAHPVVDDAAERRGYYAIPEAQRRKLTFESWRRALRAALGGDQ